MFVCEREAVLLFLYVYLKIKRPQEFVTQTRMIKQSKVMMDLVDFDMSDERRDSERPITAAVKWFYIM